MILINWNTVPDGTKVCYCNDVTLGEIRKAIHDGASTLEDIQRDTSACTGNMCEEKNPSGGCCETDILKILSVYGKVSSGGECKCCKQ